MNEPVPVPAAIQPTHWHATARSNEHPGEVAAAFRDSFVALFDAQFPRLFRYLDRLSGDPELAADLAQDAFVRLYRRGSLPESPEAWLISVGLNLFRNTRTTAARRRRLLTPWTGRRGHGEAPPSAARELEAETNRYEVRRALDCLPERERSLLLLKAEGYSYRDIAAALRLREGSVGTLLGRAVQAFRRAYGRPSDAH